jgi:hypothetical protein
LQLAPHNILFDPIALFLLVLCASMEPIVPMDATVSNRKKPIFPLTFEPVHVLCPADNNNNNNNNGFFSLSFSQSFFRLRPSSSIREI